MSTVMSICYKLLRMTFTDHHAVINYDFHGLLERPCGKKAGTA
ncbi:hypothetical protein NPIL_566821, partial [Nephila pilipes]